MTNNFFPYLEWITKATNNKPEFIKNIGYIANRWLSMASKPIAQIVNSTSNRWNIQDEEVLAKFHHAVIPKYAKNINYIKKPSKEDEEIDENFDMLCENMQISQKELHMYNQTLAELNLKK
jgi:hypothetical protein